MPKVSPGQPLVRVGVPILGIGVGLFASFIILKAQRAGESRRYAGHPSAPIPTLSLQSEGASETSDKLATTFLYRGSPQRVPPSPAPRLRFPLHEAWRTEPLNVGAHTASKSSAAVDGTGVYVGSDAGEFRAYDLHGKLRWKFALLKNKQGFHGTALLDERFAYIGAYNGRFYKFEKSTGKIHWATRLADAIGTAPLKLQNGDLVVSAEKTYRDGFLLRLNSANGRVKWRSASFFEQVHSSPTITPLETVAYVGDNRGIYHAIDLETGRTLWKQNLGGAIKGSGALKDGVLYVNSWGRALWALSADTGRILWRHELPGISQSSPLLAGDVIFTSSQRPSILRGVERSSGRELWTIPVSEGREGLASALLVQDGNGRNLGIAQCKADTLCAVDATTGRIAYEYTVPGLITSLPAIFGERIYLTLDQGPMLVLEGRSGAKP